MLLVKLLLELLVWGEEVRVPTVVGMSRGCMSHVLMRRVAS